MGSRKRFSRTGERPSRGWLGVPTARLRATPVAALAGGQVPLSRYCSAAASRAARIARGLPATRPHKLGDADQRRLVRLRSQGEPISELSSIFGVSAATVYRVLSRHREAATSAA